MATPGWASGRASDLADASVPTSVPDNTMQTGCRARNKLNQGRNSWPEVRRPCGQGACAVAGAEVAVHSARARGHGSGCGERHGRTSQAWPNQPGLHRHIASPVAALKHVPCALHGGCPGQPPSKTVRSISKSPDLAGTLKIAVRCQTPQRPRSSDSDTETDSPPLTCSTTHRGSRSYAARGILYARLAPKPMHGKLCSFSP